MITITILGSGNVAQNLFEAFSVKESVSVVQVVGRKLSSLAYFKGRSALATFHDTLKSADIYILAISDDAISALSAKLNVNGLLVHTSGAVPLSALKNHERIGVFYPLQTFTLGKPVDFANIPICIETNDDDSFQLLNRLGQVLSNNVSHVDSIKRKSLHLAAVFVNNFTNYMYVLGQDICMKNEVEFSMLQPLIQETAAKIMTMNPIDAQTGPAKRGDQKTLHEHLNLLKDKNQREIYTLLSNSIKVGQQSKEQL